MIEPSPPLLHQLFTAIASLADGLITVDRENRITYINPAAEAMTGWSLQEALGKPSGLVFRVVNALTGKADWQPVSSAMSENRPFVLLPNSLLIRKDMTELPIDDTTNPMHNTADEVIGAVITFRDLGKNFTLLRDVLERTHLDELTGLSKRTALEERLSGRPIAVASSTQPILLYLDLDQFKEVNDTFGHPAGDVVLQTTAKRIRSSVPKDATVCRLGGDEFVVLVDSDCSHKAAQELTNRVLLAVQEPIEFLSTQIRVTASIGVAVGTNQQHLIEVADQAMYRAKRAGGNRAEWIQCADTQQPAQRNTGP